MEMFSPRPLSGQEFLAVWETGAAQHPLDRGLTILSAGYPQVTWQALADLSIGQRDGLLLDLYACTFGARLPAQAACPACQHALAFDLDTSMLRLDTGAANAGPFQDQAPGGLILEYRLPTSRDLASLVAAQPANGSRYLAQRCILQVSQPGAAQVLEADELPDNLLETFSAGIAAHDPQADLDIALTCPECGHTWQLAFDILDFFWTEIRAQALRLGQEVHRLALAYGWSERDILQMSAARRRMYLELVGN